MNNKQRLVERGACDGVGIPADVEGSQGLAAGYFGVELDQASMAFRRAIDLMLLIAQTRAHALIEGETGTGKELAARAIHYLGPRRSNPFVPVNCGALPDALLESELFGHARGAFTDARDASTGLVVHARGGTLFLDEIECLTPRAQATLLRFLQSGEYRAVGSTQASHADVRVIAASNRDLGELARAGQFREDLLYRLKVMILTMPPLRERDGDVVLLTRHFLRKFALEYGTAPVELDAATGAGLQAYAWPGNVRELENLVHRECLLARGGAVQIRVPDPSAGRAALGGEEGGAWYSDKMLSMPLQEAKALALARFERAYLQSMIEASRWNVASAARRSGKERRAFGKLLKKYGIERRGEPREVLVQP